MSKQNNELGVVYVLTNPMMPGIVKIGMTLRKDVKKRMKELFGTGVPLPFKCEYACSVELDRCKELELALHNAFHPYRVNPNREFFQIEPYQAIGLLKFYDKGAKDMTKEVSEDINTDLTPADVAAVELELKKQSKRPPLNFDKMGIPHDAVLVFDKDTSITCTVYSDRKIVYKVTITSLAAITKEILNRTYTPQPTPYWSYNGKNLQDIYDETYQFTEEE